MRDTLVIDSVQIAKWQSQPDFDYNRELVEGGMTFSEWLMQKINELLGDLLGQMWGNSLVSWSLAILGLSVLVIIGLYVWRHNPQLFQGKGSLQPDEDGTEDTIYGVDFENTISQAVDREDWREAIRLRYLQTLKALSDNGQIDWQPYKTPMQYVQELNKSFQTSPGKGSFRALTAHFLRVRYGNFPATQELYTEVCDLRKEVNHGA
jgi:hypothetical protein